MAELNENSTVSDIVASYRRNMSYFEDADVTKAKRYCTAVRALLGRPSEEEMGGRGGAAHKFDTETLQRELRQAEDYVRQNDTSRNPTVTGADFTYFDRRGR